MYEMCHIFMHSEKFDRTVYMCLFLLFGMLGYCIKKNIMEGCVFPISTSANKRTASWAMYTISLDR